jgi:hypothetical protein
MSDNRAEIEITASTARLPAALRAATGMVERFAKATGSAVGAATAPLFDIGKRAIGHMVGNLATRGLDFVIDQGHNVLKFEESLTRLGLASRKHGADLRQIGNDARSLSTSTGLDAVEVLRRTRVRRSGGRRELHGGETVADLARLAGIRL